MHLSLLYCGDNGMKRWWFAAFIILMIGGVVLLHHQATSAPAPRVDSNRHKVPDCGEGCPVEELNQAADANRKGYMKFLQIALETYWYRYGRSPQSLQDVVDAKLIKGILRDPVTKEPPMYSPTDATHGCYAEMHLSDGSAIRAYCTP